MELFIKNMVCIRCKMIVKLELEKAGLTFDRLELGRVHITGTPGLDQLEEFRQGLINSGLELIKSKKSILVEKIKNVIFEMLNNTAEPLRMNFSDHLSEKLNLDYTYLANMFSESQETSIEQFIIKQKIQKVKYLISCNELTLTEISWKMHYSSVAHLSTQFKKVTGITPSIYKQYPQSRYLLLENV
ncbi:AraC-type DNA-binding protein [Daejeonella rubra]|uniref:AraC-type DNA-binding protein n=2 Tax=Daejeonella rubra TaxID=990371 RepID=A0A1G9QPY4_9SPHI|nr:AraC-type DNA-binding protein [Daejeonella rubra]